MKALITLVIALASVPWRAFVAMILWGWFIVPLGLPPIGKAEAYGLMCLLQCFMPWDTSKKDENSAGVQVFVSFMAPALLLLIGYVTHCFQ